MGIEQKIQRLHKKGVVLSDLSTVLKKFSQAQAVAIEQYRIKRFINRPFSILINLEVLEPEKASYFVKLYKNTDVEKRRDMLRREFEVTRFWFARFKQSQRFATIEPIWADEELLAMITREQVGINLLDCIQRTIRLFPSPGTVKKMESYLSLTGGWLAYFQRFPISEDIPFLDRSQAITLDYFLEYISIRLERMEKNPHINCTPAFQKRIKDYMTAQWQHVTPESITPCLAHSDFSLSNIMVGPEKIVVLDFLKSQVSIPFKDLTRLYHQLYLLTYKPDYQKKFIFRLQKAFLEGWGDARANEQPLFRIFYLVHHITHIGKLSRYWEYNLAERLYNRWVVRKSLNHLEEILSEWM